MADSPRKASNGPVRLTIKLAGEALDEMVQVRRVQVFSALNSIPRAEIEVEDGSIASMKFPLSERDNFKPGTKIQLLCGYGSKSKPIFIGVIVAQSLALSDEGGGRLTLSCKDPAQSMVQFCHSANFIKQKDSDVISTLIGNHSGLSADVTATDIQYPELVQFNCTDWDFMLTRAELNGFVVAVADGKITVGPPKVSESPVLTVTCGTDLIAFDARVDAQHQLKSVEAAGWDLKKQSAISAKAPTESLNSQGDLDGAALAKVFNSQTFTLQTGTPLEQGALKGWAKAQQVKTGLSRMRGSLSFRGNAAAVPGCIIELVGVGKRYSGNLYISAVEHEICAGNWICRAEFGLSPQWSAEHRDLAVPGASALLPPVEGLQVGKVLKLDGDPQQQNRIQVEVPVMQAQTPGVWARLASYYCSEGIGNFFIPEPGDEVVLGYFNNNPCEPVILGSLYSSARKPPYQIEKENNTKALVTRSEMKIEFNEKDKIITIETPGGHKTVMDDKNKSVLWQDSHGNKIKTSSAGIEMESIKDVKISAKGNISTDSAMKTAMNAKTDFTAQGLNMKLTAQTQLEAAGNASAKFSASGMTTIQGGMVKIN